MPTRNTTYRARKATHHDGLRGEGHFVVFASSKGWDVYRGLDGHTPYDFIVDDGERLLRVEVKWIGSVQHGHGNHYYCTATKLNRSNYDYLYVATPHGHYWIPAEACPKDTLSLKVQGTEDMYERNISNPGKYEAYRVQ